MGKYEAVTIFDGHGNRMELGAPNKNGKLGIIVVDSAGDTACFIPNTDKQSDIIQHFINFNPDAKDLALKRVSYELLTMRKNLERMMESNRLLREDVARLQAQLTK